MASPSLQSMCCVFLTNTSNRSTHIHHRLQVVHWDTISGSYNGLCVAAASVSLIAAAYQLTPKRPRTTLRSQKDIDAFIRQNWMICWLATADLLASLCVLIRAIVWLAGLDPWTPTTQRDLDFPHLFCAISSALVQYFYLSTYCWTLCYAVDVNLLVRGIKSKMLWYHLTCWGLPACLCIIGLTTFYTPSLTECHHEPVYWLPHYLISYLPILIIMIANPIIYRTTSKSLQISMRGMGLYTQHERDKLATIRRRFFIVTLVFTLCWAPNMLNGILLPVTWNIPIGVFYALWHLMALMNPLQAFLNSIVYRGLGGCSVEYVDRPETSFLTTSGAHNSLPGRKRRTNVQDATSTDWDDSTEVSPLLSLKT